MKYINLFENNEAYQAAKYDLYYPNVSLAGEAIVFAENEPEPFYSLAVTAVDAGVQTIGFKMMYGKEDVTSTVTAATIKSITVNSSSFAAFIRYAAINNGVISFSRPVATTIFTSSGDMRLTITIDGQDVISPVYSYPQSTETDDADGNEEEMPGNLSWQSAMDVAEGTTVYGVRVNQDYNGMKITMAGMSGDLEGTILNNCHSFTLPNNSGGQLVVNEGDTLTIGLDEEATGGGTTDYYSLSAGGNNLVVFSQEANYYYNNGEVEYQQASPIGISVDNEVEIIELLVSE